jgi:DNA-binding transcriptional MerR regulator
MRSIDTLTMRTGTKVQTIKSCERIGLVPEPGRTASRQRPHHAADLDRLAFIRHARRAGFTLEAMRIDPSGSPGRRCAETDAIARGQRAETDAIARGQRAEVERRMARLSALRSDMRRVPEECSRDAAAASRMPGLLHGHAACLADHGAEP